MLYCFSREIYSPEEIAKELRDELLYPQYGFDNPLSHQSIRRFLTDKGYHRTVGMVFGYRFRGLLLPLLDGGDVSCFLETVSRGATEVCEEFYDTLTDIVLVGSSESPYCG